MRNVFIVSSAGDTDLAKAAIRKMLENNVPPEDIFVIPLTSIAQSRITDLNVQVKTFSDQNIKQKILDFIQWNDITQAYIGVPSPIDETLAFDIANSLEIPCIMAYEYMCKAPANHPFWQNFVSLSQKSHIQFVVPLAEAKNDLHQLNPNAPVTVIGHLSVDNAFKPGTVNKADIRQKLEVKEDEKLAFISGTTQPIDTDMDFLRILLEELSTGQYPQLQLRFGIHPGIKEKRIYVAKLLEVCSQYPGIAEQFKIILPPDIEQSLENINLNFPFFLKIDVNGNDAAEAANTVGQAVPGAPLTKAAIEGKPAYHNQTLKSYLPSHCFAGTVHSFFQTEWTEPLTRDSIGAPKEDVGTCLSNFMSNNLR